MVQDWNDFIEPLYHNEYERLFHIAYRTTKSWEAAQDLVQETFLLAIFHQEKLKKHPKPEAWLILALRNLIANEQRVQSHKEVSLEEAAEVPEQTAETPLSGLLPVQLKPEDRKMLIWRFELQMSYHDMSEQLGISEDACRKRVLHAVNKCRKFIHN
ncbi:MAG: sigma-70 family RNA polymerase sigma factor [Oscillospiraceae bacterium]|nr:sigma-70 family RNA polymerase sigma factor [Oscillospiraceae bacterium]